MTPPTRPPGRPRDPGIDDAVLSAATEILDADGYAAVTMEAVARRAGVGKAALYRRWPQRSRLVLEVLRLRMAGLVAVDTGCTLCDLHEVVTTTTGLFTSLGPGTLAQLLAEGSTDRALHDELVDVLVEPVRASVRRTLEHARDRGDLRPGTDLTLGTDALCALAFHRLLLDGEPLTGSEVESVVVGVLGGIAEQPDRLLADYRSRERGGAHPRHRRDRTGQRREARS